MLDAGTLLILVIALALIFDFINGFHDTANAIATSVSTRVLSPKTAIVMASIMNLVGAMSGTAVAKTVGAGLVDPASVTQLTILSALIAATLWDLLTWYYGLPTSSSHAMLSSLIGAAIASAGTGVIIGAGVVKILMGLVFSPIVGFGLGYLAMTAIAVAFRNTTPSAVNNTFKRLQIMSAAYIAFSHGNNDAQKTMGIITMALVSYGALTSFVVPLWVIFACALAISFGTAAGGWRIIKTLGVKLAPLRPVNGFAVDSVAATVIEIASRIGLPLSTTHVISSTIMGVGSSQRLSAVRWAVGGNIILAWVITIPICMILSWAICSVLHLMLG
ncbi:MAG TPA: inorganic phosphate transporter [Dissulfurispiraceae bacterium]|nr:inorganic phosphate transporter [Dissulfurispiraceae bacterium]